MPSSVTTFLLRPRQFFDRRADRLDGVEGGVLAVVLSLIFTVLLAVVLRLFATQFTGTTTVDNPAYPGDTFCENGVGGTTPMGCDVSPTVTREISALVWEQATQVLPGLFVGLLILWFLLGVALYVAALVAGGSGDFGETLAVTAWGLIPTVAVGVVAGAALVGFAATADLSGSSPQALLAQVRGFQAGVSGLTFLAIQIAGAAWQAIVWAGGLRVVHGLSRFGAVAVSLVVAIVPVVLS